MSLYSTGPGLFWIFVGKKFCSIDLSCDVDNRMFLDVVLHPIL
jgi:hypothetical protein